MISKKLIVAIVLHLSSLLVNGTPLSAIEPGISKSDLSFVHFLLWTRANSNDYGYFDLVNGDSGSLSSSHYNSQFDTYILLHGYTDNGTKKWILDTKTELLNLKQCNVISVEFSALAPAPNYPGAVSNMYLVANYTATLIDWLVDAAGASTSRMHITGHSLGAHAAGLTAAYVTSGTIDRVTGLDPAGPLFYNKPADQRLDKSQATFVDVIHTNGCPIIQGCDGMLKQIGHVDFYPNGGSQMTGCTDQEGKDDGCSHQVVTAYWTESISAGTSTQNTFVSWPCEDWLLFTSGSCVDCGAGCLKMGFHVERGITGLYYLYTNGNSTYARGDSQVAPLYTTYT